jgi:hypothetical protein
VFDSHICSLKKVVLLAILFIVPAIEPKLLFFILTYLLAHIVSYYAFSNKLILGYFNHAENNENNI